MLGLFSPLPGGSPRPSLQSTPVQQALVVVKAFQSRPLSTLVDPFAAAPGNPVPPSTLPMLNAEQLRMGSGPSRTVFQPTMAQPCRPPTFPWKISQFSPMARPPPRPPGPTAKPVPTPSHPFPPVIPGQMSSAWSPMLPITLPLQWAGSAPPVPHVATPGGQPDPKSLPSPRARSLPPKPGQRAQLPDLRRAARSPTGLLPKITAPPPATPPPDVHLLRPVAEFSGKQVQAVVAPPPSQRAAEEAEPSELKRPFLASVSGPCAQSSELWQDAGASRHAEDVAFRAMDGRASTARRMLQTWEVREDYAAAAGFDPGAP